MNLKQKTFNGAKWSALSSMITIVISVLQISLLARFLDPKEFGLLTIATVILILVDTLSDFGLSNSIIQRKEMSETQLATLYWINIIVGLTVFCVLFFGSDIISHFLNQPDLAILIEALSVAFIIIPQGQQFRALLQKEMEFTKIGITETVAVITGFAVTLIMVWFKPIALCAIWGYLAMVSVRTLMFCWYGRSIYQPSFVFDIKSVTSNLRYGGYLTADNLLNQISMNIPTMILSRTLGAVVTGGYNLAYNIAVMPPAKINPIITRVLFPAFAKIQDDQKRLRLNYYKMLSVVGLLNFAALLGLIAVSENFIIFAFGEKWRFITPVLQILCVTGILRAINNPIGALVMAKGTVDISSKLNLFRLIISVPVVWAGAETGGLIGTALGFLALQIFTTLLNYFALIRPMLGASGKEYLYSLWMPFKLALPTFSISYALGIFLDNFIAVPMLLFLQIMSGALIFLIMILISRHPLLTEMKGMMFRKLKINTPINNGNQML